MVWIWAKRLTASGDASIAPPASRIIQMPATIARGVAKKMADAITKADSEAVAGDCSLANGGIVLETGRTPVHPLSFVARAYGIPAE